MKKKLGISIYPEKVGKEETIKYIDLAYANGFRRIFANLLELKDDEAGNEKLDMLKSVYKYATDKGIEVIVDVNPTFYKEFKLPNNEIDFFANLHVSGIRLDEDFKGIVEAELSNNDKNLKIELNASATTKTIDAALANGGNPDNLIACHNFYPMRYTGLAFDRFMGLSSHFKAKGLRIAAFISLPESQKGVGPWDVNEGMPTLEPHRDMPIDEQVSDLLSLGVVDDIMISQQGATEEQFKLMGRVLAEYEKIQEEKELTIKVKLLDDVNEVEKDILLNNKGKLHFNRLDYNEFFVRSTFPRLDYKDETIKEFNTGNTLQLGDVVILNENIGRYKGELHLITQEVKDYNNARNLIGQVDKEDLFKLKFIREGIKFKIITEEIKEIKEIKWKKIKN